jgi:hypothetical protein
MKSRSSNKLASTRTEKRKRKEIGRGSRRSRGRESWLPRRKRRLTRSWRSRKRSRRRCLSRCRKRVVLLSSKRRRGCLVECLN